MNASFFCLFLLESERVIIFFYLRKKKLTEFFKITKKTKKYGKIWKNVREVNF
jgi:hypothetical protein